MGTAIIIEVADAMVAALNGAGIEAFSKEFTAARAYLAALEPEDLATVRVSVVPKSMTEEIETRASVDVMCSIDVAVQQQVNPTDLTMMDGLMLLAQEIATFFENNPVMADIGRLRRTEHAAIFSPGDLDERRVFTAVLTLTFSAEKEIG